MPRLKGAVYLRQNALAEPLYNQWYAWPYLVSPMTAPMYVGNLHLRLMESFLANATERDRSSCCIEECWLLGVPAGTLFGKKEVVFQ